MARKVLESCPSCGGALEITEVHCLNCDARVQARFRTCDFCSLNEEQSTFLRIFLTSRGNLSEVEKRLGVSYPTVRAKLDEVIARLETPQPAPEPASTTASRATTGYDFSTLGAEIGATVRAALDDVLGRRAASVRPASSAPSASTETEETESSPRRAILDAIARGELSPTEGLERIRQLGGE